MLEAASVTKSFGGLLALDDVTFEIEEREIVGLIGPNGAGKTTLFNTITGMYEPESGTITFDGDTITGMKPHAVTRRGITRTFQTARTFNESTAAENVEAGVLFGSEDAVDMEQAVDRAMRYLEFVGLEEKADEEASSFTIADRKLLELAKSLAAEPDVVLVDEIASGLTPPEVEQITQILEDARSELGVSVFWIEHIMDAIMDSTDRIIVLDQGEKIAEGTPAEIQQNERVAEAYLGDADA